MEINPILVKELRSRVRGNRSFVLLSVYLLVLCGFALMLYVALMPQDSNSLNAGQEIGKNLFSSIGAIALLEVCLITPALTSGSIAGEKERQTYDLLIASLLQPRQIVLGKLLSSLAYAALLVVTVVPVMSMAFVFGGVTLAEMGIVLIVLLVTSVLYAAIGLFWSIVVRSAPMATAFAIGTAVVVLVGVPILLLLGLVLFGVRGPEDLQADATSVYVLQLLYSVNPFLALWQTGESLDAGQGALLNSVKLGSGGSVSVVSPWLLYSMISVLMSAAIVAVCVRLLQPEQPEVFDTEPTPRPRRRRARGGDVAGDVG